MWWLILLFAGVATVIAWRAGQRWVAPWRDIERLIDDVANVRAPSTFLIDGNHHARRAALRLEEVFLRQRELDQRASEGALDVRTILGAMPDGLCVVDEGARVRLLNAAVRRMFRINGTSTSATLIQTFRDNLVVQVVEDALRSRSSTRGMIKLRSTSGGMREVAITALPIANDTGHGGGAIVLFEDVTQLQQLEEVRRDFVSNVSHELRTPLSIFRGYLETLLDEPELPADERERILRVLEKHSTRLNSLVDDLLSLARLEAPDPHLQYSDVDVREFVERIAKDWEKRAAAKQLRIVVNAAGDLPRISVDEARLEEIVHNLLDNAVKYSNAGAQIVIAVARHRDSDVVLEVSDEGTGIAAADLPRIFERFYRADKARSREVGGTGLGLSIVKHIVQLHGGTVEAESQLGRGTTIRVVLPISAQTAAAAA
ncbi:MAG: PAS domain-containing protein [Chthoniobacterales bacterium]|nr:PAS domain-containing protein [Chthoniobacterales bacterium]